MKYSKVLLINVNEGTLDQEYWDGLASLTEKITHLPKDDPNIIKELADTECLLTGFGIVVSKDMIDAASSLKYIGVQATAFDKIDIEYAASKGIPVCNLGGYSTDSVAEFAIAAVLEASRGLEEGKQRGRAGNFSEDGIAARELKGSEFGVIGLGNIGKRVAEIASGFGANVSYWSRHQKEVPFTYTELDELVSQSEFLSLNPALTPETEHLLNAQRIASLKPGATVINTCPMDLVDIDALVERLKKADITFIFDHADEMSKEDLAKLAPYKNCIAYPPIAYISAEARRNKGEIFIGNIQHALEGMPTYKVN
jgi:lactate dehydrogenase-like 2-hydroxyacid dehydrogenase